VLTVAVSPPRRFAAPALSHSDLEHRIENQKAQRAEQQFAKRARKEAKRKEKQNERLAEREKSLIR
jgi:hypothetical protein